MGAPARDAAVRAADPVRVYLRGTTVSESSLERDIGRLQAEVATLQKQADLMQRQIADMHKVIMQAQGSWKALVMASGAGAAVAAAGMKLAALLGFGR